MAMTPRQSNPLLALVARLLPPAMGLLVACSPSTGGNVSGDAGKTKNDGSGVVGDVSDAKNVDIKQPKDTFKPADGVVQIDAGPPVCEPPCQPGYACFGVGGQAVCLVDPNLACAPCSTDLHCLGGRCEKVDGQGPFCLIPCPSGAVGPANCPAGTTCSPGEGGHLCRSDSGSCTCLPALHGETRPCAAPGAAACPGFQLCGPGGWAECATPEIKPEVCDGADNDCDGQIDEGQVAGQTCNLTSPFGTCKGKRKCGGEAGWLCEGAMPAAELCNGVDDNCNGTTDEPWLAAGKYIGDEHCGLCGNSCAKFEAHGVGACDPDGFPPHCVLAKCDAGWVPGAKGCVPKPPDPCTGPTCPCTAALAGKQRICSIKGQAGTCEGVETCKPPFGWLGCTAKEPATEVCNGLDDDCDGQIDDGVNTGTACTISNPAGACKGKVVCSGSAGSWCDGPTPAVEVCNGQDDDCDGKADEGFIDPASGTYLGVEYCGDCATSCAFPPGQHVQAACVAGAGDKPKCSSKCEAGWFDANDAPLDGCECHKVGENDTPGGGDADCDGVDGDEEKAVFVAKSGSDSNPGTRFAPVATIGKGISLAAAQGKRDVLVGAGAYAGDLKLAAGVSVWGGYGKGFAQRDPDNHETLVVGADPAKGDAMTVRCEGIAGAGLPTRLDGVTVLGGTPKEPGRASFTLYAVGCDARLQVVGNRIFAGNGAPGAVGGPGVHGKGGKSGKNGKMAKDIGHPKCVPWDHNKGGVGGLAVCNGVAVGGGGGGTAICPDFDEATKPPACPYGGKHKQTKLVIEIGQKGSGAGSGAGGMAGSDAYIDPNNGFITKCKDPESSCNRCETGLSKLTGNDGGSGAAGKPGKSGSGCATPGKVVGGKWQPGIGAAGSPATPGGGGGGGGAAGGVEVIQCVGQAGYSDIGSSGGGGGSGGCGGGGGQPATSGGPSFAVLVVINKAGATGPVLKGNVLHGGKGGDGGSGGPGGYGGFGGLGAPGGLHAQKVSKSFCATKGGAGGSGGQGGHGAGGGGGCGGPAALIAGQGVAAKALNGWQSGNVFQQPGTAGKSGVGGISAGHPGKSGLKGKVSPTLSF